MLGGIDPIIIFQIYKKLPAAAAAPSQGPKKTDRPLTAQTTGKATLAVIPIYLSQKLTGVHVDDESKNIDIDTTPDSLANGEPALVNQKALGSVTSISLTALKDSVGLTILLALAEMILDKVTSQEYEITYVNGAVTVFGGLVHGLSVEQGSDNNLYKIKIDVSRGRPKTASVPVEEDPNAVRLGTTGAVPPPNAPTAPAPSGGGASVIQPGRT